MMMKIIDFILNHKEEIFLSKENKNICLLKILYNIFSNKKSRWLIYTDKENIDFFIKKISLFSKYNPINKSFKIKDSEIILLLKDDQKDLGKLLCLECTGIYINKLYDVKKEVYEIAKARIGRYPKGVLGSIFSDGVI